MDTTKFVTVKYRKWIAVVAKNFCSVERLVKGRWVPMYLDEVPPRFREKIRAAYKKDILNKK